MTMDIRTYFSDIKNKILDELCIAEKSIKVALAFFTDNEIFEVLCEQARNGRNIELILSNEINYKEGSLNFLKIIRSGGNCYFYQNDNNCLMHNKFSIIDDKIVITGSYNWTIKAQQNRENIVIIKNNVVVNEFHNEFIRLKKNSIEKLNLIANLNSISDILNSNTKEECILPTYFTDLDKIIQGFRSGELVIVAGRRAMGTTSFQLNCIINLLKNQIVPIGIFSLDLKANDIIARLLMINSETEISQVENSLNKETEKNNTIDKNWLSKQPIFIDDTPSLTLDELQYKITQLVDNYKVKIVFIDHLDYLKFTTKSNSYFNKLQNEFDNELIIRELKKIARILNISIILSCKIGKIEDTRNVDKRPYLTNLQGNLDYYANMIIFLHRPEIYGILEDEEGYSTENLTEVIVASNRNGRIGAINLNFSKSNFLLSIYKTEILENVSNVSEVNSKLNKPKFSFDSEEPPF
jgi:replicative DNA helicase